MPRSSEIPSWVYPGTRVIGRPTGQVWLIESLQFRGAEGYHVFLKPEGRRGIPGWFPAENIARSYYPVGSSAAPQVRSIELLDLVYRGSINIAPAPGAFSEDVLVHNLTEDPIELSEVVLAPGVGTRVCSPGWESSTYVQLGERQTRVSFDDHPASPYTIREIRVEDGVQIVLEADPFAGDTDEGVSLYDAVGSEELEPTPVQETLPEPAAPTRRISVWERIAALRNEKGPDAIPGGAGTGRGAHIFNTTDDGDGVT